MYPLFLYLVLYQLRSMCIICVNMSKMALSCEYVQYILTYELYFV